MLKCKHARSKTVQGHIKSRIMISLLTLTLLCCVSISGTLAWMMCRTEPVVNTFTCGDIRITLEETGVAADASVRENHYAMARGFAITKDPTITVEAGSEPCWLFVQLDKSENFDTYLRYEVEAGMDAWQWMDLSDAQTTTGTAVYYRPVSYREADQDFTVLAYNTVYVQDSVTLEMMEALTDETYPTLTVTAYAIQQEGIDQALDAWTLIRGSSTAPDNK